MVAARNQCPTNPAACEDAARWGEGGRYRTALHMAVGGMSFGSAGAAGSLASGAMSNAIEQLGITDSGAINALHMLAVTMAGAAASGTAGAAAAFNADTNNRQLHNNEKQRLRELAAGNVENEQRLAAAACYLVRCSAQFPTGSQAREAMLALEGVGGTLTAEIALLRQQTDSSGAMFTYGYFAGYRDDASRIWNESQFLTRLGGLAQITGGTASGLAGSMLVGSGLAACGPTAGGGCVAAGGGALMWLWGSDQISAGAQTLTSGVPTYTLGAHLISDVTGISLTSAELWYALPSVSTGGSAAQLATPQSRELAQNWLQAAATYYRIAPRGIQVTDQVMASPPAQALVAELRLGGFMDDASLKIAREMIASGSTLVTPAVAVSGTTLFKIVPRGTQITATSVYWMTASQAQAVSRMSIDQSSNFLGLPLAQRLTAQQAGGFDFYTISAVQPATVFQSTIARTVERNISQTAGGSQVLVPNRSIWTPAVRVDPLQPSTFSPRPPPGG